MRSNRHRCPFALMPQIRALRTLSVLPVFSTSRLTSKFSIDFSGLTFCLFFSSIFGPFGFSESICFMNFLLLIDSMITPFMTYILSNSPELPLSLHFYIGCSIWSTQSKRESLPDFIFRIIFIIPEYPTSLCVIVIPGF